MLEKMNGIVLRTMRYGDDSLIVDIFTDRRGTLSFMVRVPRSRRAGVKGQLLRPLSILELDVNFKEKARLHRIKDMRIAVPYTSLPYEPAKEAIAMFLGEVLSYALRHETSNPMLFVFMKNSLDWLDNAEVGFANFHLCMLLQMTRYLGFMPNTDDFHPTDIFDLQEGCFTSIAPLHGFYLRPAEAAIVPALMDMNYATMHTMKLNRVQRGRILQVIALYYRLHIPDFPELKSLDVLTELFE